jgi:hypothetical protein
VAAACPCCTAPSGDKAPFVDGFRGRKVCQKEFVLSGAATVSAAATTTAASPVSMGSAVAKGLAPSTASLVAVARPLRSPRTDPIGVSRPDLSSRIAAFCPRVSAVPVLVPIPTFDVPAGAALAPTLLAPCLPREEKTPHADPRAENIGRRDLLPNSCFCDSPFTELLGAAFSLLEDAGPESDDLHAVAAFDFIRLPPSLATCFSRSTLAFSSRRTAMFS